ncbi:MAG: DUF5053 domain-containing protein [Candidatus Symbiothrix sp.]|nr:DUF5053 domain-containing protein [Candidatus Symbiothrix sp.]
MNMYNSAEAGLRSWNWNESVWISCFLSNRLCATFGWWLHQKINGNVKNGKPAKFTNAEIEIFNFALQDISKKIGSIAIHP